MPQYVRPVGRTRDFLGSIAANFTGTVDILANAAQLRTPLSDDYKSYTTDVLVEAFDLDTSSFLFQGVSAASVLTGIGSAGAAAGRGLAAGRSKVGGLKSRSASKPVSYKPDHILPIGPASEKAWTVLNRVDAKGAPLPGFKGGKVFGNREGILPRTPGLTYREWDVNPYVKGVNRGPERIVTGSDGSAYWTGDHYRSFLTIRKPTG
ncbi:ribonuclease domain-containing protein [Aeromicrobium sp.]|uniref:ribonuclease domain-containing protein n=1 Tax=Aeromicrobium sp. TaxID=1871063 RepID=UPI0035185ED1